MPEITLVLGASESPAGREPEEIDQVYGVVPPVAASVALYAAFCVPFGREAVVMTGPDGPAAAANVATIADQFVPALNEKVPLNDPVVIANIDSFAARELTVSCSWTVYPLPAVCVPG